VIFSYITTLARNDKIFITRLDPVLLGVAGRLGLIIALGKDVLHRSLHIGLIYSSSRGNLILFLTGYLLLSLLAIVKMTQFHKGALTT